MLLAHLRGKTVASYEEYRRLALDSQEFALTLAPMIIMTIIITLLLLRLIIIIMMIMIIMIMILVVIRLREARAGTWPRPRRPPP